MSECVSKCVASSASRSAISRLSSVMMPTAAWLVVATAAGAVNCSVRSAARICCARLSIFRCRPACLSADRILDRLRCAASVGWERGPDGQGVAVG